jgi:hypothetical protein
MTRRWWFIPILCCGWLQSAFALPQRLGDLNQDGVPTATDLVGLIGYMNDTNSLPLDLSYFTDLNEDGVVSQADIDLLADDQCHHGRGCRRKLLD